MPSRTAEPARRFRLHEVAAGIVWNGSEVLIARREAHDHQGGRWEFPGGKRREGESIEECLRREMLEEIGIEVAVGALWRALTHIYPDRAVSLYFHMCEASRGTPRAIECADFTFVEGDVQVLPDLARDLDSMSRAAKG